jgi:hypothetical protein
MILVLTSQAGDFSHLKFIDWLNYLGASYAIITGESILKGEKIFSIIDNNVYYDKVNLTNEVSCVFYRRWFTSYDVQVSTDEYLNDSLNRNLSSEMYEIRNFLFSNLKKAVWIPGADTINVNKLSVLAEAAKCELNVPEYIVTNSKTDLLAFYKKFDGKIITKAIGNFQKSYTKTGELINPIYTKNIDEDLIRNLSNTFFPSIFQEMIVKKHEYRIIYFNKKCYATAILSQENSLTILDSRMNNDSVESKIVAVKLDAEIELKITHLMKNLNLPIGSIDLLHSIDDKYYFLEVNPVGQIGGYSERCLLNFEKDVVEELIRIDNKNAK